MTGRSVSGSTSSLRSQLTWLVVALGLPLLLLQGWWSFHDLGEARRDAEANALAVADAMALGVVQFFSQAEELMTSTAERFGDGWLVDEACPQHMVTVTELFPFLLNAVAVGPAGEVICSALPAPPGASARDWPWYPRVVANPVFTLGEPVEADFTGGWILPLVAPITDGSGAFAGAIVGTVELGRLSRLFGSLAIPADHLVTVACSQIPSRHGRLGLVIHPDGLPIRLKNGIEQIAGLFLRPQQRAAVHIPHPGGPAAAGGRQQPLPIR